MIAKRTVRLAFLLLLLLLFCWQLVQAPWFLAVKEVEIRNITNISPWEVEQIGGIHRGMSLLRMDLKQMKVRLEADQRILHVELRRSLPSTLIITVQENVGVAAVPYFSSWLEVNQEGRVLAVTNQFSSLNLPIVTGLTTSVVKVGDMLTDLAGWAIAQSCFELLPPSVLGQISEINVEDPASIVFYSTDPLRILIGDANNMAKKIRTLTGMLGRIREDHKDELPNGQLDVSSGRAVFIKGHKEKEPGR